MRTRTQLARLMNDPTTNDSATHAVQGKEISMRNKTIPTALAALAVTFAVAACGTAEVVTSKPGGDGTRGASPSAVATAKGCTILTEGEVETVLGPGASVFEAPLQGGKWCSWKPTGQATITSLELVMAQGEDRFDEAMEQAEGGGGLHDTDPALGPLGFTSDDGQTATVAWVVDDQSVVLSLTAGDLSTDDLAVLAKAVNARLSA